MALKGWVDIETTGDNAEKHALVQVAIHVYNEDKFLGKGNFTFRPFPGDKLKKEALKANGHTVESLMKLEDPHKSFSRFKGFCQRFVDPFDSNDKMLFYAYNAQFDFQFLYKWTQLKVNFPYFGSFFWWPPIDIASIVVDNHPKIRQELKSFKLGDVAKYFGIEIDDDALHDADYDIDVARQVYYLAKKGVEV